MLEVTMGISTTCQQIFELSLNWLYNPVCVVHALNGLSLGSLSYCQVNVIWE